MEASSMQKQADGYNVSSCTSTEVKDPESSILHLSLDKDDKCSVCRVCQCLESDRLGEAALSLLNIIPPCLEGSDVNMKDARSSLKAIEDVKDQKNNVIQPGFIELVSPDGEILVCHNDIETGSGHQHDLLVNLGCLCKGDLALAHYACALKWFINHGSTICEICGTVARNIRPDDFKKVSACLDDYGAQTERAARGQPNHVCVNVYPGDDSDAAAAIRRLRLSEIILWFNPQLNSTTVSYGAPDQPSSLILPENATTSESLTAKWAVEGTGILVATGLLSVTLAWLIAPRVGKRTARSGLHILLGGLCALTIVIFLRLVILSRIKYGPARYWAILFIFWFLVFGIWASRGHGTHTA